MIKPNSLRAHLTAALPALQVDPDKLLVFIDRGSVVATAAPGLSYEYRYTLSLILTDFADDPDRVMVPLMQWLSTHQNELLASPALREQIGFQADLIANDKVDLEISLPLTERVIVKQREDGNFDIKHAPEPEQIW
jgi:hypothetical protein